MSALLRLPDDWRTDPDAGVSHRTLRLREDAHERGTEMQADAEKYAAALETFLAVVRDCASLDDINFCGLGCQSDVIGVLEDARVSVDWQDVTADLVADMRRADR